MKTKELACECQSVNGLVCLFFKPVALDYRCSAQGDESTASPLINPLIQPLWLACVSHTDADALRKERIRARRGKVNRTGRGRRRSTRGSMEGMQVMGKEECKRFCERCSRSGLYRPVGQKTYLYLNRRKSKKTESRDRLEQTCEAHSPTTVDTGRRVNPWDLILTTFPLSTAAWISRCHLLLCGRGIIVALPLEPPELSDYF